MATDVDVHGHQPILEYGEPISNVVMFGNDNMQFEVDNNYTDIWHANNSQTPKNLDELQMMERDMRA